MNLSWKTYVLIGFIILCVIAYLVYRFTPSKGVTEIKGQEQIIIGELEKADIEHVKTEEKLYKQLAEKQKQITVLDGRNADLETKIKNITIPSTPSGLVDAYHRLGFRSARVVSRP
jgi:hypothetical protein